MQYCDHDDTSQEIRLPRVGVWQAESSQKQARIMFDSKWKLFKFYLESNEERVQSFTKASNWVATMPPAMAIVLLFVAIVPHAVATASDGDRAARRVYLAPSIDDHLAARPGCHRSPREPSPPG